MDHNTFQREGLWLAKECPHLFRWIQHPHVHAQGFIRFIEHTPDFSIRYDTVWHPVYQEPAWCVTAINTHNQPVRLQALRQYIGDVNCFMSGDYHPDLQIPALMTHSCGTPQWIHRKSLIRYIALTAPDIGIHITPDMYSRMIQHDDTRAQA